MEHDKDHLQDAVCGRDVDGDALKWLTLSDLSCRCGIEAVLRGFVPGISYQHFPTHLCFCKVSSAKLKSCGHFYLPLYNYAKPCTPFCQPQVSKHLLLRYSCRWDYHKLPPTPVKEPSTLFIVGRVLDVTKERTQAFMGTNICLCCKNTCELSSLKSCGA